MRSPFQTRVEANLRHDRNTAGLDLLLAVDDPLDRAFDDTETIQPELLDKVVRETEDASLRPAIEATGRFMLKVQELRNQGQVELSPFMTRGFLTRAIKEVAAPPSQPPTS